MKIILDNGHGIDTAGKRSPQWQSGIPQILEYEYNRRITNAINKALPKETIILVPETHDVSLKDRVERINRLCNQFGKNNTLLVSVHLNAFTTSIPRGWEIHTIKGITPSDRYADIFWNNAQRILTVDNIPIRNKFKNDFYILKNSLCPAVLTENLFMTNEDDCKYLLSENGFKNIVQLHIDSIKEILIT